MHLAAANEYLKNHIKENASEFRKGAIAPDFVSDTDISHHSKSSIRDNALSFLLGKVVLKDCLGDFDMNTPFGRGYFFHLITDYEYYRSLVKDRDMLSSMTYREIKDKLYHDYAATNRYFKEKYDVVLPDKAKQYDIDEPDELQIIDIDEASVIIEWLGRIDLNDYLEGVITK